MKSYPWDSVVSGLDANGYPILDRAYSAADLRDVYSAFLTEGVFMDGTGGLAVTAGDGMSVVVAAGRCFVRGAIGVEPSARELALQAASSADRIDAVVLRWDASIEARSIDLYVKTGVAASVPTRPALTRSETVWELGLADVFVPASSTAVSAERITDTRLETERCGAVAPFAPVDTDTFFDQIQAAIDKQTAELQAQTDRAVELAEKAVDETLAGELMQEIEDLVARAAHPGVIYPFGGSVLPPNFLWCDGAEHSRTEYPELFAAIGTAYGAGDGSTTFNVPDLRGRVAMGASDAHPMGETGGEEKHAQTVEEMPRHRHSAVTYTTNTGGLATPSAFAESAVVDAHYSWRNANVIAVTGNSQPFNVMQPYATTQYIIATGKGGGVSVADIVQGAQALPLAVEYGGTGATDLAEFGRGMAAYANEMGVYSLAGGPEIPEGADLNDYKEVGNYACSYGAVAATLANCPTVYYFTLKVEFGDLDGNITQTLRCTGSGEVYFRIWSEPNAYWTDWVYTGGIDAIVAQGTSGNWHYWKWDSGLAICHATVTHMVESMAPATGNDGVCVYMAYFDIATPFPFVDNTAMCSASILNYTAEWAKAGIYTDNNVRYAMYTTNPYWTASSGTFDIAVIGRWK